MEIIIPDSNKGIEQQFQEVVGFITSARDKVYRVANSALIDLYWQIGKYISLRIKDAQWGDGVVAQLADYIQQNIPDAKGFSDKNLWRMRQFYDTYNDTDAKLSSMMRELVPVAGNAFRDSYVIEFLGGKSYPDEYSMKQAIIAKMKDFLLEIGKDFIFMNQEYRLQVGTEDFRVDLLFFHRELRCLVAFEVKMGRFHPSHLGQLEFYLEALDRDVRKPHENPSIGILLCKDKDDEVVEYAMARSLSPTLVAQYQLQLPDKKILQAKIKEIFDTVEE